VGSGQIERLADFPSKFVDARPIDVRLPPGYSAAKRYQVLYMHDGQMLFDASITWNKLAWQVDVPLARLMHEGRVPDTLVVGIWNNGKFRHSEYFPQKFLRHVSAPFRQSFVAEYLLEKPQADNYLRFIVEELKPAIDRRYATLPEREHTFVMGSSMGGAISVYAMNEYPQIFGGAAGLSLAWVGMGKANFELPLAAFDYLRDSLAAPEQHRLYMDHGDGGMDAWFANYQAFVDEIVRDKGYTTANWQTRRLPGTGHSERDWAARLEEPLTFLLRAPTASSR
jgi:enterochelin esterase-like enzyme